ncbi:MAG TPA: hypothetical protein VIS94_12595 [Desulfomonilia bacterium]|jgi:hypothetical protein
MMTTETSSQSKGNWEGVRPVVIYFAGERFVVEYGEHYNRMSSPIVALVHAYIGSSGITNCLH